MGANAVGILVGRFDRGQLALPAPVIPPPWEGEPPPNASCPYSVADHETHHRPTWGVPF